MGLCGVATALNGPISGLSRAGSDEADLDSREFHKIVDDVCDADTCSWAIETNSDFLSMERMARQFEIA